MRCFWQRDSDNAVGGTLVSAAPLHATDSSTLESAVRFKQFVLEKIAQCQRARTHSRSRSPRRSAGMAYGALPAAEALVDDLADFERQLRATTLTAQGLLNGTTKLAYEIGENKAAGGESPVSGHSLAELRGNAASIAAAYEQVFARAIKKRDAGLAKIFSLDLEETRALLSVRSLKRLDRARLRNLSAWLASDLVLAGQEIGLEKPDLATE